MKDSINSPIYAFFGSYDFSAVVLNYLIKRNILPALIICAPDKTIGRKKEINFSPVKKIALEFKIPFLQPKNLNNFEFPKNVNFDFFLIAAYSKIIPEKILYLPKLKTLAIHPSLLPKYRGPSPIQTAILEGNQEFGTTLFLADAKIDHGPIIKRSKLRTENSSFNYEELSEKLAKLGAEILLETLPSFLKSKITPLPQNESEATYTRKFKTEDGLVDLKKDNPILIERKIRALNPEPGTYALLSQKEIEDILGYKIAKFDDRKRVKLLEVEIKNGFLTLKKVQVEGKKPSFVNKKILKIGDN